MSGPLLRLPRAAVETAARAGIAHRARRLGLKDGWDEMDADERAEICDTAQAVITAFLRAWL